MSTTITVTANRLPGGSAQLGLLFAQQEAYQAQAEAWEMAQLAAQPDLDPEDSLLGEFFDRLADKFIDKILDGVISSTNPNPLYNQDAINQREQSSTFDINDVAMDVLVFNESNNELFRFWIMENGDHWLDMDADRTPDTLVQINDFGAHWDSNGNGSGDTIFLNPYELQWPGG